MTYDSLPLQKETMYIVRSIYVVVVAVIITAIFCRFKRKKKSLNGKHVLITGGSSGIGLEVGREVVRRGAKVTLFARNESKLASAKESIQKSLPSAEIQIFSVDVAGCEKMISEAIQQSESKFGPTFMLVNCAGCSKPGKFEELTKDDIKTTLDINLLGSIYVTQEVVRSMKHKAEGGIIVFTSSLAGLFGLFGFSVYAAAKGAIVKLAEALHMELKPYDISVTVSLPPDTDTPGLHEENKRKPNETKLISESAGLFKAEEVANQLLNHALDGQFFSSIGIEGYMLQTLCSGMSPITSFFRLLMQIFFTGPFRIISSYYLWNFARIIKTETDKAQQSKKAE